MEMRKAARRPDETEIGLPSLTVGARMHPTPFVRSFEKRVALAERLSLAVALRRQHLTDAMLTMRSARLTRGQQRHAQLHLEALAAGELHLTASGAMAIRNAIAMTHAELGDGLIFMWGPDGRPTLMEQYARIASALAAQNCT